MKLLQRVPLFYTQDFTQLLLHSDNLVSIFYPIIMKQSRKSWFKFPTSKEDTEFGFFQVAARASNPVG